MTQSEILLGFSRFTKRKYTTDHKMTMSMTTRAKHENDQQQKQLHQRQRISSRRLIVPLLFWRNNNGNKGLPMSSFSLVYIVRCISIILLISTLFVNVHLIQSLTKATTTTTTTRKSTSTRNNRSTMRQKNMSSSSFLNGIHLQPSLTTTSSEPRHSQLYIMTSVLNKQSTTTTTSDNETKMEKQHRIRQETASAAAASSLEDERTASAGAAASSAAAVRPLLWESSTVLPRWMKDYFTWHAEQRRLLSLLEIHQNKNNNNNNTNVDLQQFKFLVVRCLYQDDKCGGTADRLKPLPFYLRLAHSLQRILIFKWQRPVPLQEFLQPPQHIDNNNNNTVIIGMDWTWPSFLDDHYYNFPACLEPEIYNAKHIKQYSGWNLPRSWNEKENANHNTMKKQQQSNGKQQQVLLPQAVVSMRYQNHGHGADEYDWLVAQNNLNNNNTTIKEATFVQVFRHAWYIVFEPVPVIQQRIKKIMNSWRQNITHGQSNTYDAIHIRALYHNAQPDIDSLRSLSRHAVNCLHTLQQLQLPKSPLYLTTATNNSSSSLSIKQQQQQEYQYPIFIASDDVRASDFAHAYANRKGVRTLRSIIISNITAPSNTTAPADVVVPLHLDRGMNFLARHVENWTTHEASNYYNVFVDLYLLANARCIAYNVGNFGKWANLLSMHPECEISHLKNKCPWGE